MTAGVELRDSFGMDAFGGRVDAGSGTEGAGAAAPCGAGDKKAKRIATTSAKHRIAAISAKPKILLILSMPYASLHLLSEPEQALDPVYEKLQQVVLAVVAF